MQLKDREDKERHRTHLEDRASNALFFLFGLGAAAILNLATTVFHDAMTQTFFKPGTVANEVYTYVILGLTMVVLLYSLWIFRALYLRTLREFETFIIEGKPIYPTKIEVLRAKLKLAYDSWRERKK